MRAAALRGPKPINNHTPAPLPAWAAAAGHRVDARWCSLSDRARHLQVWGTRARRTRQWLRSAAPHLQMASARRTVGRQRERGSSGAMQPPPPPCLAPRAQPSGAAVQRQQQAARTNNTSSHGVWWFSSYSALPPLPPGPPRAPCVCKTRCNVLRQAGQAPPMANCTRRRPGVLTQRGLPASARLPRRRSARPLQLKSHAPGPTIVSSPPSSPPVSPTPRDRPCPPSPPAPPPRVPPHLHQPQHCPERL